MPLNRGYNRAYNLLKTIEDYGETLVLKSMRTISPISYDPTTSDLITNTDNETITFKGYLYESNESIVVDQSLMTVSKKRCLIPALELTVIPDVDDIITRGGETYRIIAVRSTFSNGQPIQYSCELAE